MNAAGGSPIQFLANSAASSLDDEQTSENVECKLCKIELYRQRERREINF